MSPVIRVTDDLYERLGKHASGFESPSKVIEKLLKAYESTNHQGGNASSISSAPGDAMSMLEQGFKTLLNVEPRPFGQKNSSKRGFSDDNNGVQWNVRIDQETDIATLGVNLEGMKYKDWPIARLLLREKDELRLPELSSIIEADEIRVGLYRDAWQAAARPMIDEKNIVGSETPLSEISEELWSEMIEEALLCLNADNNYRGRVTSEVTITKTGMVVEKEVSPHLNIHTDMWTKPPENIEEVTNKLETAYNRLLPVYDFIQSQTLS